MKMCLLLLALYVFPTTAADSDSFTGTWDTTFGEMKLTQKDNKVTGTYGEVKNTLEGTVDKKKLTFSYKEAEETGEGVFELSADGKSFTGKYKAKGTDTFVEWKGTRK